MMDVPTGSSPQLPRDTASAAAEGQGGGISAGPPAKVDWAAWLKEYGPRLLLYARQQARTEADAEDIMQEALVQLVRAVEGGSFMGGPSKWPSYTYTAIRHLAADRGRREDSQARYLQRFRDGMEVVEYPSPWLAAAEGDSQLREQVESLLRTLPSDFAEVVVLRIWGEYSFREIAEMTSSNPSTVTSRYRYAMQALRKKLGTNPLMP